MSWRGKSELLGSGGENYKMRFALRLNKETNNIEVLKDFRDPDSMEEVARFITELEIAKLELIEIFEKFRQ